MSESVEIRKLMESFDRVSEAEPEDGIERLGIPQEPEDDIERLGVSDYEFILDWKTSPEETIKEINKALEKHGLRIQVNDEEGNDWIAGSIVKA